MASDAGKNLIKTISDEKGDYEKKQLEFAPSFARTTPNIISLIDMYWVDKFQGGDTDDNGWKRAFYNVIENPTMVASKQIDLDTKDIRIKASDGKSFYPSWLYTRDLNLWMKKRNFGVLLNELVYALPKYGFIIVKKADGNKVFNVHPASIVFEADAETLEASRYITATHNMAVHQLEEMDGTWKNVKVAMNEAKQEATKRIKVFERYGQHPDFKDTNYQIVTEKGTVLHTDKKELKDLYRMLKWDNIRGRLAGRGVVEKLFEAQINRNRVEEFKNTGLDWTSKIIFQSKDTSFLRNLLTDVENGEVLTSGEPLTQVNNQEKNLPAYRDFTADWDKNIRERTFAFPEVSGERPPAGTPLGTTQATLAQAGGFYDMKREELGMFIKGIITDWIIPEFKKERRVEHKLMLGEFDEDEITKIRGVFQTREVNKQILNYITKNGTLPDDQTIELIKATTAETLKKKKELTIPKGYYDQVQENADVIITNEMIDVAAKLTTFQTVFTMLAQNPEILNDPRTRRLFNRWMDLGGLNPVEAGTVDIDPPTVPQAVTGASANGGSPPRPNPIPSNARGTSQAVV